MTHIENEYSHIVKLDEIGQGSSRHEISAGADEMAALANRFDLISLNRLTAEFDMTRNGQTVNATGRFHANIVQACIASGDPVPGEIDEAITIRFTPEPRHENDAEIELGEEDCDIMFHNGKVIDIGEAVSQSLGLALNPYPRSPNAEEKLRAAGVKTEGEAGPFGALSALKDKMAGK